MSSFNTPTPAEIDQLIPKIASPQYAHYFFQRLRNPLWIRPLADKGMFSHPPSVQEMPGGGRLSPNWPQSRYLSNMASIAPDAVSEVITKIETANWSIGSDFIRAVRDMPAKYAASLVDKIGEFAKSPYLDYAIDDVGQIIANLASAGYVAAAMKLAAHSYSIDSSEVSPRGRDGDYYRWDSLLETVIPSLLPRCPSELMALLDTWLRQTMETAEEGPADCDAVSYIWRPAIEDHEQNNDSVLPAKLVQCLRIACEDAVRSGQLPAAAVIGRFTESDSQVRRRLQIHLTAEFRDQAPDFARNTMLDRALFEDYAVKHEYARLMNCGWHLLEGHERQTWLGWVEAGPSDQDAEPHADYWKFRRLHWIREHLEGEWKLFYDRMYGEHGSPSLADLNVEFTSRWGYGESPMTVEQLQAMSFAEATRAVAEWRPQEPRGWEQPSPEALLQTYKHFIAANPQEASGHALLLKKRGPRVVHAYLEAMRAAIKEGTTVELDAVLALAQAVVDNSDRSEAASTRGATWDRCRDLIADLIEDACDATTSGGVRTYSVDRAEQMIEIITRLLDKPPRVNFPYEDRDPRVTDWMLVGINSARGLAMQSLVAHIEWRAVSLGGDLQEQSFEGGLQQMPDVRELLESQLSRSDPSASERCGFGLRLGLLVWLDRPWLESHIAEIFDLGDPPNPLGWAAWSCFLSRSRPHRVFYELLEGQFSYAVASAKDLPDGSDLTFDPSKRLAEHMLVLYGRGDMGQDLDSALESNDEILRRLVTETDLRVRSHAMQFVGESFRNGPGDIPPEVFARFQDLWDFYWEQAGKIDAAADPDSAVFGYWFGSGVFNPVWALKRFEAFVQQAPRANPEHRILKQLGSIAHVDPVRAAKIIFLLAEGDENGWRVTHRHEGARDALRVALAAGGEAGKYARRAIDRLGRRGHLEFGELLKDEDE